MLKELRQLLNAIVLLLACDQACSDRGNHLLYSTSATVSQLQVALPDICYDSNSAIMVPCHRLSNVKELTYFITFQKMFFYQKTMIWE